MWDEAKQLKQLEEIYKKATIDILNILLKKEKLGQSTLFYKNQLKAIMKILSKLDIDAVKWVQDNIPACYNSSMLNTQAYIMNVLNYNQYPYTQFNTIHQKSIDVLTQNLTNNLRSANQFMGRHFKDIFRQTQLQEVSNKVATGKTIKETTKQMVESYKKQGIPCFKDRLGRNWSLETYSKMCARTVTRESATVAMINTCGEANVDLLQMSTHIGACPLCQQYQGKIYSISGRSKDYPIVPFPNGYWVIHPNCCHVFSPYIKELNN